MNDDDVEMYWATIDEDPTTLADLYLDFHIFSRIEFGIFRDRLSAAILVARAAKKQINQLEEHFKTQQQDGSHIVPGWEAESDDYLGVNMGTVETAYHLYIGATTVTAVAALEALLMDLTPDDEALPRGLHRLWIAFLDRYKVIGETRLRMIQQEQKIGKRRNTFAHALTGPYFSREKSIQDMFTEGTLQDTLQTVGNLAVEMEMLVLAHKEAAGP
jgi:hypothetical protein